MMCICAVGLLIPCTMQYIYLVLFLDKVMNLWNSDVNLVNWHKVIRVSVSFAVLQKISRARMLYCVYYVQC